MKIQLNETQVKNLISGYKTLREQEFRTPGVSEGSWEVNFSALWGPGKWKLTQSHLSNMKPELTKIVSYLKKHPNSKLNIQIVASESRVTNYDREQSGDVKVQEGYLSNKRGEEMRQKLDLFFKQLNLENSVVIPKAETRVGGPQWNPSTDRADDKKFTDHQYVKLVITGTYSYECLVGMNIKVWTKGSSDGHTCDEAIFDFLVNGISLGVVNLNNGSIDSGEEEMGDDVRGTRLMRTIRSYNKSRIMGQYARPMSKEIYDDYIAKKRAKTFDGLLSDYVWQGKKISEWGKELGIETKIVGMSLLQTLLVNYWMANKPTEVTNYIDLDEPSSVIPDSFEGSPVLGPYVGQSVDQIFNQPKDMIDKVKNIEGRETDGKKGGFRSQTFTLDTNKAAEIVKQSKTKDMLILSIKPLVGLAGPYRLFYRSGSHTEVPRIRITGKDGEERYQGQPNAGLDKGVMDEKDILKVDICGNDLDGGTTQQ